MERLFQDGQVVRRDIEQVYEGLYIDAVGNFESFLEDIFIGLLVGSIKCSTKQIIVRTSFKCHAIAREVVYAGRKYVDWLPYYITEKRAKVFFRNGEPFVSLLKTDKDFLDKACCIRNAIAHESRYAQHRFENEVIGTISFMPRERTPAGFLRGTFRTAPVQTRYEFYISQMSLIAHKIKI
jgi:hypothetical protein